MKKFILFFIMAIIAYGQDDLLVLDINKVEQTKNYDVHLINELSEPNYERLGNQTKSAVVLSLAAMGVLYTLPYDFTGWNGFDLKKLGPQHTYNVRERGPVWDPDNIFFNFIAHPYVGATYYIAARKSGFKEFDSFKYSFCMSAFLWEFGIESFQEAPSIQDLVITPGAGSVLGEYLFRLEDTIIKNNGKVLDSKLLGRTTLVLIDPIGTMANIMGYKDDSVIGVWTFVKGKNNGLQLGYSLQGEF